MQSRRATELEAIDILDECVHEIMQYSFVFSCAVSVAAPHPVITIFIKKDATHSFPCEYEKQLPNGEICYVSTQIIFQVDHDNIVFC